ncbi:ABC transporter permease [Tenuibacillus multivorans]|uniref:ABC-2 type transport system permease protein n=1 Tax=Tenuibacillus multivorans TaxID=237069 RepID=A0A1H0C385_9BACI|nr:ABC transporter permease [Tenuibacillus multivorans]SDN52335.1 ABC-2 type transport system permease protein [Tenuibacillus multivorans]
MDREKFSLFLQNTANSPFWVLVQKEIRDHITSIRFNILMVIILLTCIGSLYSALTSIRDVASNIDSSKELFLYLKIFTISGENGALPPFITFISLLGPLLGIAMGFDAINSEKNNKTLLRIMSQPIPRDYLILAKFTGSLFVIAFLVLMLGALIFSLGILIIGIPPTFEEFIRVFVYLMMIVLYIAFWLALSILFSILFKQAATSALSGIAIWLFFSVFYSIIVNLIVTAAMPEDLFQANQTQAMNQEKMTMYMRLSPNYLISEITTVLLNPGFRTLGPVTMEQATGAIPSPLGISESLTIIWPQVFGILALCTVCFLIAYAIFMRQEIRS